MAARAPAGGGEQLTLHEAADRLGVHYMTVYRHVRLGMLPARKVGGSWRVDPADVATEQRAGGPTRPPAPGATGTTLHGIEASTTGAVGRAPPAADAGR